MTPRNGTVINQVEECGAADIDAAVTAARRAFEDGRWRNLHYREKKHILFALADLMERDAEMLAFRRLQAIRLRLHALYKYADLKSISITLR